MKRIRTAIIGQGRSGFAIHARALRIMTDRYEIVAISDIWEDRCKESAADIGCDGYVDYREMIQRDDIDLVVNASPSHLHVPISKEILQAGKNLLCEKPFARKASDVDEVVAEGKKAGRMVAAFQQSRFAPYFQKVREVIDSGVLGRIVQIRIAFNGFSRRWDWQTLQKYNGGSLLNTGPHPLDQALQLFGEGADPNVFCLMDYATTFGDAEDHVKLILSGADRPTIDLEISSCSPYPLYTYQLYGTRGGLTGTTTHLEWKYYKDEEAPEQHLTEEPLPGQAYCREDLKWHEDSWEPTADQSDMFQVMSKAIYGNLYDALTKDAALVVTMDQVRRQVAVIEECHRQNQAAR